LGPRRPQPTLTEAVRQMHGRVDRLRTAVVKWTRLLTPLLFVLGLFVALIGLFVKVDRAVPFGAVIVAVLTLVPTVVDVREQLAGHEAYRNWLRRRTDPVIRAIRMRLLGRIFRRYGQYEAAQQVDPEAAAWFAPEEQIYRSRRRLLVLGVALLGLAGLSAWYLWPHTGTSDTVPGREFALGPKLRVTVRELSCRAGEARTAQPDTCSVSTVFKNAGHDPYRVGPESIGRITASGPVFDGRQYASALTVGGAYYSFDAGLSRFASSELPPGTETTATLVYDVTYAKVTATGAAPVTLLFTAYPGTSATRVTIPSPQKRGVR